MNPIEDQFFKVLSKRLWTAADKLRSNLDAALYKHAVPGLIILRYVSDAFIERLEELQEQFRDPAHEYYLGGDEGLAISVSTTMFSLPAATQVQPARKTTMNRLRRRWRG